MSIFHKRTQQTVQNPTPSTPSISTEDIDLCEQLLVKFDETVGTDAERRAAALEIARAGGLPEPGSRSFLAAASEARDVGLVQRRPWQWLCRVGSAAHTAHKYLTAGRVGFFFIFWKKQMAPQVKGIADYESTGLDSPPPDLYRNTVSVALQSLVNVADDELVNRPEGIDAKTARFVCAYEIAQDADNSSPDIQALADSVILQYRKEHG